MIKLYPAHHKVWDHKLEQMPVSYLVKDQVKNQIVYQFYSQFWVTRWQIFRVAQTYD